MTRVLVAGETLVDMFQEASDDGAGTDVFRRQAGGAPANVAATLAALGRSPDFWTKLGADAHSEFLEATLVEAGVSPRFVERDPDAKTTLTFVSHDPDADRSFTFYRDSPADTRLQPGRIPDAALREYEWIYVGGVLLTVEPARSALLDLVERARDFDNQVVFDPNVRPDLVDDGFTETFHAALSHADVVKATPEELSAVGLSGEREALAETLLAHGAHTVLLTLGADGAEAYATEDAPWGRTRLSHPGYAVTPVDTTGAGDAFTGAAIAALAAGEPLEEVLDFANAVGAFTTTGRGGMAALPDREAVRRFREGRAP